MASDLKLMSCLWNFPLNIFFFLVKVTVKFIKGRTGGRREREKHFMFPM
jgi:hypothetical protein